MNMITEEDVEEVEVDSWKVDTEEVEAESHSWSLAMAAGMDLVKPISISAWELSKIKNITHKTLHS